MILQEDAIEPGTWTSIGLFDGANSDAAIRAAAGAIFEAGALQARLVACPARSWKPRTASVRPVPAITLS